MTATEGPPNHPKTFGEELQRLRESAGLSVDDIMAETKISRQILTGLESGDFRFLPQKVFCRNFVVQYAAVVGADGDHLASAFEAAWERFVLASGAHPRITVDEAPFARRFRWQFWLPAVSAAVVLVVAGLVILRGSAREEQLGAETVSSPVVPEARPVPPAARFKETASVPPQVTEQTDQAEKVVIVIRVRPEAECWIHYRDRDGAAGGKLLAGGAEERIELVGPVKLTVGDADAVVLEVAGMTYKDLGRPGQVVHTEVSSTGLVVLGGGVRDE
jgi:cytoskeletal protein RodZ